MTLKNPKYRFNAKTKRLFVNGDYVHLPGVLLDFLFWLSCTVEHTPFLPPDEKIKGKAIPDLRKRLGKYIGPANAKELVECISGYGYRFNPGLLEKRILIVLHQPKKGVSGMGNYVDIDRYAPYNQKTGGYHEPEEEDKDEDEDDDDES